MVLQTQFADIRGNDLYIDGVKATDLAKKYGTPLYVMSEGHIRHQMNELKEKFMDKYETNHLAVLLSINLRVNMALGLIVSLLVKSVLL